MKNEGFTLIELLMTVAIVGLLSAAAVFVYIHSLKNARDAGREQVMQLTKGALEIYYIRNQSFPNSPNDFCGTYLTLANNGYFTGVPTDPTTHDNVCSSVTEGNKYLNGAMYNYTATPSSGTAGSYVLTLVKESGGRADFYSPQ